jgi:hypothetical protein
MGGVDGRSSDFKSNQATTLTIRHDEIKNTYLVQDVYKWRRQLDSSLKNDSVKMPPYYANDRI